MVIGSILPVRNSDEMTIGKTHLALFDDNVEKTPITRSATLAVKFEGGSIEK